MNSLPPELFLNHDKLYLKVEVDMEDGEGLRHLAPDQLITATPRALVAEVAKVAKVAEKVGNGAITRDMLNQEVLSQLDANATSSSSAHVTITRGMLPQDVRDDLNKTITYDRLAPSALDAIFSTSLASITAGKIKIVSFGKTPPNGYSLYHRGKAENLIWKFTPSSPSPGATFDKTIIYNNRVITMGKENGFQQNPVLSTWTNFYSINNSIGQYSTALLSDNVYLIGGHDGNSKSNRLRIFNLINSSFSEAAPTPVPAQHKTAQALNGKIFETGGWKSGNGGSRRTFCYDPVLDEWTEKSLTNFGRIHSASIVYQNKMWIIGGENNSADKVESYHTTNDNWTVEKSLFKGRKQASCWVFEDYLFVGGGKDVNGAILDSIECYDPRTETWYNWGQLPNPVTGCAAFVVGDLLHIFDGVGNAGVLTLDLNKSVSNLNDIYIQDGNASAGTPVVQAEVADGSVTTAKIASKTIGKDQISDEILKYLKPEITEQPQTLSVLAESNTSFSFSAEGKYLSYQWKKNGNILNGETNATLTITDSNATLHDGNYSVVVSNDFGSVESGEILVDVNTTWSTDGLVGWWKFDETNGPIAYDSSGNGNDGNLSGGPTWTSGKIGGALHLDGVDDYVKVMHSDELNLVNSFSIALWVKISRKAASGDYTSDQNLISKRLNLVNYSEAYALKVFGPDRPNAGRAEFGTNASTFSPPWHAGSSIFDTNGWYHLTVTIDNQSVKIYINSSTDSESSYTGQLSINEQPIFIGIKADMTRAVKGLIDDIRIYNRALSAAEVQALYNLGQ